MLERLTSRDRVSFGFFFFETVGIGKDQVRGKLSRLVFSGMYLSTMANASAKFVKVSFRERRYYHAMDEAHAVLQYKPNCDRCWQA